MHVGSPTGKHGAVTAALEMSATLDLGEMTVGYFGARRSMGKALLIGVPRRQRGVARSPPPGVPPWGATGFE